MIEEESKTALMQRRERATGCGNMDMGTREGRVEVKGLMLCFVRDVGNNNNNN
jgi:hypothetical protein